MSGVEPAVGTTSELASFAARASVPASTREAARRCLLDWLGSALAGGELRPPTIIRGIVEELGGHTHATVLATGQRTSAPLAALANAAAAHVLEMDDLDRDSISHPGAPVIAAALAAGEYAGAAGRELLDAVAVGYEVTTRVGAALGPSHYEHWHTTGTAGTLGAAASAARLLRLDAEATLRAFGSAGTMAAGLWEFLADGAMSKQLHPAKAAHDGLLATMLGRNGFTGASRILEGPKGLLAAMSAEPRAHLLTEGLAPAPRHWRIERVSFKVHASCRHTHSAVDAALRLRSRLPAGTTIERVDVRLYRQGLELLDGVAAATPYAAKFSLPFCVASALVHGDLAPARFTEDTIRDPAVLALAERVQCAADAELDAFYPLAWPSVVTLTTGDGATLSERVDHPAGDPESRLDDEQLAEKFASLTASLIDHPRELAHRILVADPPPTADGIATAVNATRVSPVSPAPR